MPVVSTTDASAADASNDACPRNPRHLLFTGLVDDAAVFPPGLAPLDVAVREHHAHRRSWYADVVGPLLCPADRSAELVEHLRWADAPTAVTLVAPSVTAALNATEALGGSFELAALEFPLPSEHNPAATAAELDRLAAWAAVHRPDRPPALWVEVPRGHAVRHTDPATGFEHHGLLNVICAVHAATGSSVRGTDVADIFAAHDAEPLVDIVHGMDAEDARRVRSTFASFGCCGVTDPVDDLVSRRLLAHSEEIPP